MKKRAVLSVALCAALALGCASALVGCDRGTTQSGREADYTLTFYRSRNSGMTDGSDEDLVTQALEDKYYEETGDSVRLVMKMYSGNDLSTQVDINYPKSNTDLECVTHYLSDADGSAISKYAKEEGATVDMKDLLEEYGQNILKAIRTNDEGHLAERAAWFKNGDEWGMHAIPGVSEESCFAVLLRKDMVRAVQDVTGIDPEDYDIVNDEYGNLTFNEFYKLMWAIKQNVQGVTYPIVGAPWDIGRVFGTAFGVDAFNNAYDADGNFGPSQLQPEYDRYLQMMWHWAKDGVWEKDASVNSDDNRLTAFVAGQAACYIAYPEIKNLITVARRAQAANPGSEYMIIAPLATSTDISDYDYLFEDTVDIANLPTEASGEGERQVIGNLSNPRAFYGLILPYMNEQPENYIKFIDWMYSDVENYELAKYGIKGTHWVEGEDKVVDGVSYKTWKYPDQYAAQYQEKAPYSGAWEILENINVSNRLRYDYNTLETKWYVKVTNDFETYCSGTEGIWMGEIPRELNSEAGHIGEWIENVRGKAWAGIYGGPNRDQTPAELLAEYAADMQEKAPNYLKYIADEHKAAQDYFDQLFAEKA